MKKESTELLGMFGVDSGQVMIGDPCYLDNFVANNFEDIRRHKHKKSGKVLQYGKDFTSYTEIIPEYKKTMSELNSNGEWIELPHPHAKDRSYSYRGSAMATIHGDGGELKGKTGAPFALSVVSSTGFGDGVYPVYATKEDGRVKELTIKFF